MNLGLGNFPDVAFDGRVWVAFQRDRDLFVRSFHAETQQGLDTIRLSLEAGSLAFSRLSVVEGLLWLIYRNGARAVLHNLTADVQKPLGAAFGNDPVCAGFGWFAWQDEDAKAVLRIHGQTAEVLTARRELRPTGLSRLVPTYFEADASLGVVFVDEDRLAEANMTRPCYAPGVVVGEAADSGILARATSGVIEGVLLPGVETFTPRVCAIGPDRWVAATWGRAGVEVVWFSRADLKARPLPSPAPVPAPSPSPKLEPSMQLSEPVKHTIREMFNRFGELNRGSEDDRRAWTRMVAEQLVFSFPGENWGHKSGDPGRPPSKDAIARKVDGRLFGWDLVNGATRQLQIDGLHGEDITGQHFIDVPARNHLGATAPTPVPQPPPTKPPPPADISLESKVDAILRILTAHFR